MPRLARSLRAAALGLALAACGANGPRAVALGEDACAFCRMEVTDARFAAEVVTTAGRVHVFDSIDCMAGYAARAAEGSIRTLWVTDVEHPGTWVEAERAGYLVDASLHGPMGHAVAFATAGAARAAQATYGGTLADWATVRVDTTAHGGP